MERLEKRQQFTIALAVIVHLFECFCRYLILDGGYAGTVKQCREILCGFQ